MGTGPDGVRRSGRNRKKAKLLDGWYLLCETSQSLNYYVTIIISLTDDVKCYKL